MKILSFVHDVRTFEMTPNRVAFCRLFSPKLRSVLLLCRIDILEGQLFLFFVHILSGMAGPQIWQNKVSHCAMYPACGMAFCVFT